MKHIAAYWDKQSKIWREEKEEEWMGHSPAQWASYFKTRKENLSAYDALEVGTASGYFANILHQAGFTVSAMDISPSMIEEAIQVSHQLEIPINYKIGDAQDIPFDANSFDLVFTRLMTWTIPDIKKCYSEFFRVLKPGGLLINFDGDFGKVEFSQDGHERYPADIMEQANHIKKELEVSLHKRPEYDVELLQELGFVHIKASTDSPESKILSNQKDSILFELLATKPFKS